MNLVPDTFLITMINCEIIATSSYFYNLTLLSLFQNGEVYFSVKYQQRDHFCLNTLFEIHTLKQSKSCLVTFSFCLFKKKENRCQYYLHFLDKINLVQNDLRKFTVALTINTCSCIQNLLSNS